MMRLPISFFFQKQVKIRVSGSEKKTTFVMNYLITDRLVIEFKAFII